MKARFLAFSCVVSLLLSSAMVFADSTRMSIQRQLFGEIIEKMDTAKADNVHLLAPENWERVQKYYKSARKRFDNNSNLSDIREDVAKAESYLSRAKQAAEISGISFSITLVNRSNAKSANAPDYAREAWKEAEEAFDHAARRLEDGKMKGASIAAQEVADLYQTAELLAIKENYLSGARDYIEKADELKADKYAPRTFVDAKLLLKDAERELTENRYDTDYPRDLARRARNEAQHAMTITKLAIGVKKKDFAVEDIVRNYELPLIAIATELDITPSLHKGYQETQEQIVEKVEKLNKDAQALAQYKLANEEQAAEIARLSELLGVTNEQLAAEARYKALLADLESIFNPEEAEIFRQEKNMIIRMVGLNFDSGKAELKAEHLPLLQKLKQSIELSETKEITIEGHTDSYGGDESNMELSKQRAQAVVIHLVTKLSVDPAKLAALGYGETRPIANNENPEGRAKNRRIDVVINLASIPVGIETPAPSSSVPSSASSSDVPLPDEQLEAVQ